MKIALVQDELVRRGGAEQVCLTSLRAFPNAPLFTASYNPALTYQEFKGAQITSSWFSRLAKDEKSLRKLFFPFAIWAMESLDLTEFDVVLIGGTNAGKYVKVSDKALVINYCYTPFRLAWNPLSYSEYLNSGGLKKIVFDTIIGILRKIDKKHAKRVNYFLAMTEETRDRIQKAYEPTAPIHIIPPAVKVGNFKISDSVGDYYLLVSRLEFYKKVDLAIEAFNRLGRKLIIVGKGSRSDELKAMAKSNIEFRTGISNEELADLYGNCKAFIFPQHEDYGITPLEANSAGRPVIAYKGGGVLTTQIDIEADPENGTAVFFNEQSPQGLIEAVNYFERIQDRFNPESIRKNTQRFEEDIFVEELKKFVETKYLEHTSNFHSAN